MRVASSSRRRAAGSSRHLRVASSSRRRAAGSSRHLRVASSSRRIIYKSDPTPPPYLPGVIVAVEIAEKSLKNRRSGGERKGAFATATIENHRRG
ncbi:uncharacterized protein LOC109714248 isoform X2 [Ananas comosus]|uniref:Uncharacterized protein LOC109714248 isoform X2 n=1 Tax=Ananas comosus TaxID=4615 RepID=A0A6P5FLM8_ANACO|nr:uncharacterized protein LOC109714248 isoform X2 [Ananas comosus]